MTSYNLQWSHAQLNHIEEERYAHFYALVRRGKIIFIGNAFHKNLADLISTRILNLDLDHMDIEIWLGRIREYGKARISIGQITGLHKLLVYARKPLYNKDGKLRYKGLANMKVTNVGLDLVPGTVRAENNLVFVSGVRPARRRRFPTLKAG